MWQRVSNSRFHVGEPTLSNCIAVWIDYKRIKRKNREIPSRPSSRADDNEWKVVFEHRWNTWLLYLWNDGFFDVPCRTKRSSIGREKRHFCSLRNRERLVIRRTLLSARNWSGDYLFSLLFDDATRYRVYHWIGSSAELHSGASCFTFVANQFPTISYFVANDKNSETWARNRKIRGETRRERRKLKEERKKGT